MTAEDHSAIVGDKNLWDDLVVNEDQIGEDSTTNSSGDSSSTTVVDPDQVSGDSDSTTDIEQAEKSRVQVVQVTVAESTTVVEEEENSGVVLLIPVIIAVILIVVAITILVRCFTSRRNEAFKINQRLERVPNDTQASNYVDSQYNYNDGDKNIFARTQKIERADNVILDTHADASNSEFGSRVSEASESAAKLKSESTTP